MEASLSTTFFHASDASALPRPSEPTARMIRSGSAISGGGFATAVSHPPMTSRIGTKHLLTTMTDRNLLFRLHAKTGSRFSSRFISGEFSMLAPGGKHLFHVFEQIQVRPGS